MKKLLLLLTVLFFLGPLNALGQTTERPHVEKIAPGEVSAPEPIAMLNLLKTVEPVYPEDAKSQKIAGHVVTKVLIDKEGKVVEASPLEGDAVLADITVAAVKQWKFRPYAFNSEPVSVQTTVTAEFTLDPVAVKVPQPRRGPIHLRVSQLVAEGMLLRKVDPTYPVDAKMARIQGEVLLEAEIDTKGNVSSLRLIRGHPLLVPSAAGAVRQWKYRPYVYNGEPAMLNTTISITFRL